MKCNLKFYTANIKGLAFDCVVGCDVAHRFPLHSHRSLCIGLVTEGVRRMKVGDTLLNVAKNEAFIININQPHAIDFTVPHSYIAITINGLTEKDAFRNHVCSDTVMRMLWLVAEAIIQKSDTLANRWTSLYNHIKDNYLLTQYSAQTGLLLQKVENYIVENYYNQLTVNEMAKAACMSKFHFCRRFRQTVGMSPHIYLINWRLRHANKCLKNNMPVFDTAIGAGFFDSSHLIKVFQSYMAVSPDDYRKAFR
jgi:AraC-like DNA-binding protein